MIVNLWVSRSTINGALFDRRFWLKYPTKFLEMVKFLQSVADTTGRGKYLSLNTWRLLRSIFTRLLFKAKPGRKIYKMAGRGTSGECIYAKLLWFGVRNNEFLTFRRVSTEFPWKVAVEGASLPPQLNSVRSGQKLLVSFRVSEDPIRRRAAPRDKAFKFNARDPIGRRC